MLQELEKCKILHKAPLREWQKEQQNIRVPRNLKNICNLLTVFLQRYRECLHSVGVPEPQVVLIPPLRDRVGPELNPLVVPTNQPSKPILTAASNGNQQSRRCKASNHQIITINALLWLKQATQAGAPVRQSRTCSGQCELR